MDKAGLERVARAMVAKDKGILAADESSGTIKKRFDAIQLESTEEHRRSYREMLFTTPGIGQWISGVIFYDETLRQKTQGGVPFAAWLGQQGVLPGIKVKSFAHALLFACLTAVLNTEHDVDYRDLGDGLWSVVSRSTRIAEVENDHELPAGTGHGFLWRLNAYWLVQQRGPDVYLECRSLSLSRDIPAGARFLVRPFVTSLPVESLKATLLQTVKAL